MVYEIIGVILIVLIAVYFDLKSLRDVDYICNDCYTCFDDFTLENTEKYVCPTCGSYNWTVNL